MLHLVREHDGPAEIGSLFLAPRLPPQGQRPAAATGAVPVPGRAPAGVRAAGRVGTARRDRRRGAVAVLGRGGRHFFDIDFPRADYLSVVNKKFIADLMPTHSIYIPLLPQEAQEVIGQAHEESRAGDEEPGGRGIPLLRAGGHLRRRPLRLLRPRRDPHRAREPRGDVAEIVGGGAGAAAVHDRDRTLRIPRLRGRGARSGNRRRATVRLRRTLRAGSGDAAFAVSRPTAAGPCIPGARLRRPHAPLADGAWAGGSAQASSRLDARDGHRRLRPPEYGRVGPEADANAGVSNRRTRRTTKAKGGAD